eukprot:GEZU01032707.1.p1 GENE.GEZU01032707.1~~GEZU01032707.1.p1  ORF type:complete len:1452 (-),score=490.60 GEZU01032707.1:211-4566(-)
MEAKVFSAETGEQIPVKFPAQGCIKDLKTEIEKCTGIEVDKQILLNNDGKELSSSFSLETSDKNDEKYFVLFSHKQGQNTVVEPAGLQLPDVNKIPIPKHLKDLPIGNNEVKEQVWAYCIAFYQLSKLAEIILETSQNRVESCRECIQNQRVQFQALELVHSNVLEQNRQVVDQLNNFLTTFQEQYKEQEEILANLADDIAVLKMTYLHSCHATENAKYLIDYVDVQSLKKIGEACSKVMKSIKPKLAELQTTLQNIQLEVNNVDADQQLQDEFHNLEAYLEDAESILDEQRKIINKNNNFLEVLQQALTGDDLPLRGILDSCNEFGTVDNLKQNAQFIADMKSHDRSLQDYQRNTNQTRNKFIDRINELRGQLKSVRSFSNKVALYEEVMRSNTNNLFKIKAARQLTKSYPATLQEIVRRQGFKQMLETKIEAANQELKSLCTEEIAIRERFAKDHLRYLPHPLAKGLNDKPSFIGAEICKFDTELPLIENEDHIDEGQWLDVGADDEDQIMQSKRGTSHEDDDDDDDTFSSVSSIADEAHKTHERALSPQRFLSEDSSSSSNLTFSERQSLLQSSVLLSSTTMSEAAEFKLVTGSQVYNQRIKELEERLMQQDQENIRLTEELREFKDLYRSLKEEHQATLLELQSQYEQKFNQLKEKNEHELARQLESLRSQHEADLEALRAVISQRDTEKDELEHALHKEKATNRNLDEQLTTTQRQIEALQQSLRNTESAMEQAAKSAAERISVVEREYSTVSNILASTTEQLNAASNELLNTQQKLETVEQQVESLLAELGAARSDQCNLRQQIDMYQSALDEKEALCLGITKELESTKQNYENLNSAMEKLGEKLREKTLRVDELKTGLEAATTSADEHSKRCTQLEQDLQAMQKEFNTTLRKIELENQALQERIIEAENTLEEEKAKTKSLKEQLAEKDASCSALQEELRQITQRYEFLNTAFEKLGAKYEQKTRQVVDLTEQLTEAKASMESGLQTQLDKVAKLELALNSAKAEYAELAARHQRDSSEKNKRISQLETEKSHLSEALEQALTCQQQQEAKIVNLKSAVAASEDRIAAFSAQCKELTAQLAETKKQYEKKLADEGKQATERTEKAEQALQAANQQIEKLQAAVKQANDRASATINERMQTVDRLEQQLSAANSKLAAAANEKASVEAQLQQAQQALTKMESLAAKAATADRLQQSLADANKRLKAQEQVIQERTHQLDTQIVENTNLDNKNMQLLQELANLQAELVHLNQQQSNNRNLQEMAPLLQICLTYLTRIAGHLDTPGAIAVRDRFAKAERALLESSDEASASSTSPTSLLSLFDERDLATIEDGVASLLNEVTKLSILLAESHPSPHEISIATSNFKEKDQALFLPDGKGNFEAFNRSAPHYYLSAETLQSNHVNVKQARYLIGQIVQVNKFEAPTARNPYGLPANTVYYVVHATLY